MSEKESKGLGATEVLEKVYERLFKKFGRKRFDFKEKIYRTVDSDWDACRGTSYFHLAYKEVALIKVDEKSLILGRGFSDRDSAHIIGELVVMPVTRDLPKKRDIVESLTGKGKDFEDIMTSPLSHSFVVALSSGSLLFDQSGFRSEERRVGKECRL